MRRRSWSSSASPARSTRTTLCLLAHRIEQLTEQIRDVAPLGPARGTPHPAAAGCGGYRPGYGRDSVDHDGGQPGAAGQRGIVCRPPPDRADPPALRPTHPELLRTSHQGGQNPIREIVRCLKRYAAREVFHLVRPTQPCPPRHRGCETRGPAGMLRRGHYARRLWRRSVRLGHRCTPALRFREPGAGRR